MAKIQEYPAPPSFEITDQTQLADWKKWQKSYRSYALASNLVGKSHDVQLSFFKSLMGQRALDVVQSFSIVETTDVESVIDKFDKHFGPKVNVTRERYTLYRLSQKPGQRFEDFLSDVTNQVDKCGFRSTREEIILYKIVGGIFNEDVRDALLANENLEYEKAIRICQASAEMHFMSKNEKWDGDPKEQRDPVENVQTNLKQRGGRRKVRKGSGSKGLKVSKANLQSGRKVEETGTANSREGGIGKADEVGSANQSGGIENAEEAVSARSADNTADDVGGNEHENEMLPDSPTRDSASDSDWVPDDADLTVADGPGEKPVTPKDHEKPETFSCEVCGKAFPHKKSLKRHSLIHLREKKPSVQSAGSRPKHETVKKSSESPDCFSCEVCNKVFPRKKSLKRHSLIHARGRNMEVTSVEPEQTSLSCDLCGKEFTHKDKLRNHRRNHAAKVLSCHYCNYKFGWKSYLRRHIWRQHPEKVGAVRTFHACDVCEYKTTEWKNMKRHKHKHADVKPLSCDLCDYRCSVKVQLTSHMAKHKGEKPFACKDCDFRTRFDSSMSVHKRLKHSDDKPYKCNVCGSSFKLKVALRTHMHVHTGHRPFACTVCDSKFKQRAHLTSHMRTHTGEKPYVCDVCGHRWATQGNLVAHIKIHNKTDQSPPRKRKKPQPDPVAEAPALAIPQWSEQISTINPVECFAGMEPYQYPLGVRPVGSDCRYYQQRPSDWQNSQNVSNVMPVMTGDEFQ